MTGKAGLLLQRCTLQHFQIPCTRSVWPDALCGISWLPADEPRAAKAPR